ncbi:MAG: hypothetical protein GYB42_13230 [Alphaproteobacteria bacterium]|nr:hypothetical protein [Alphaproteobacteria bacterium]
MTKFKIALGSAVFVALGSFSAAHAGNAAEYFEKIDADANGSVTQAEYVAYKTAGGKVTAEKAEAKFTKLAGDDGEMSLAELEAAMKAYSKSAKADKSR